MFVGGVPMKEKGVQNMRIFSGLALLIVCLHLINVTATAFGQSASPRVMVRPQGLQPGDTIAFVAPAGKLDRQRMNRAKARLIRLGFKVKEPDDLYAQRGYLAGSDEHRAAQLMAAFADAQVRAIFPGTGYYGATRMLDKLDYQVIRQNPKIFIGFSDITALHLAIAKKAEMVTFHSPNPMYGLGSENGLSAFSREYFWLPLMAKANQSPNASELFTPYSYDYEQEIASVKTLSPGRARGTVIGGNLSLVCALMGTEYEIDTEGRILFLEDVGERPYRIDRYLSQLKLGGKLDHLQGVILGCFSDCQPEKGKSSLSLDQVFADYFADLRVPVVIDFPAGHSRFNATIPFGVLVELDADRKIVTVLENPVAEHPPTASRTVPLASLPR